MKDLTVFILTHNRGEMLLEAIDSVLNQTCHDFNFVVSDNSSNDDTMHLLEKRGYFGKFEYRKRDREYPPMVHFNMCMSEVNTTYFVLFHDDDIMMTDYIETMYNAIVGSKYIAVGCNAYFLYGNKRSKRKNLKEYKDKLSIVLESKDLASQYCKRNGIVPFPSYMYNKKLTGTEIFDEECGKYSDVTWLLRLIKIAPICWFTIPLMYYRIHKGQDSQTLDFENQKKLLLKFQDILGQDNQYIVNYTCTLLYSEIIITYRKMNFFNMDKFKELLNVSKICALKVVLKLLYIQLSKGKTAL